MYEEIHARVKSIMGSMEDKNAKRIVEELHQRIKDVLDDQHIPVRDKNNYVSGLARQLINAGEDSGLEDSEPKQGSSRAVYFPSEHRKIKLDGHLVQTPTVVKIAFPGWLDRYNKSGSLLGEHQNQVESDPEVTKHGVIRRTKNGDYETNPQGILVPHFGNHEGNHWVELGRVETLGELAPGAMAAVTKTEEMPEGLNHRRFSHVLDKGWSEAHGKRERWDDWENKIRNHPLVRKAEHLIGETGLNPGDFTEDNMGIWTHPVTGEKHVVISDYGYDNNVAKHYYAAKQERYKHTDA